jgi:pyrroloquinoline quinone (PQQ) biosynthesis protein C
MTQSDADQAQGSIGDAIVAVRELWHTKKHPFFAALAAGTLPLGAMGIYMAQHYRFVEKALPAFGLLLYRAPDDVRLALIENLAEEAGLKAGVHDGAEPHDHMEMIFAFCRAAGMAEDRVRRIEPTPAWWARILHYVNCLREEPIGVALAMQSTQEGQQVALNQEVAIPALQAHYGFPPDGPAIAFFVEHAEADLEHSRRQLQLCEKYLATAELRERALVVCEQAVRLRWASITDLYRDEVLGQPDPLPPGIATQ